MHLLVSEERDSHHCHHYRNPKTNESICLCGGKEAIVEKHYTD
jgi:hypothetical protein